MDTTIYRITLPGVPDGTWPITDDKLAVEQVMLDQQNPQRCALQQDELWGELGPYGLHGLDATAAEEKITIPRPEGIKASTVYLVAGVSILAVAGAILLWASRGK